MVKCVDEIDMLTVPHFSFRTEKSKASLVLHPTASHGSYLLDSKQRNQIVEQIQSFLVDPPSKDLSIPANADKARVKANAWH